MLKYIKGADSLDILVEEEKPFSFILYNISLKFVVYIIAHTVLIFFLLFFMIKIRLGEHGIRSSYGILTVLKSPDPPKILQGDYMVTTEDREIELECVSENGKPAAEVPIHTDLINFHFDGVRDAIRCRQSYT